MIPSGVKLVLRSLILMGLFSNWLRADVYKEPRTGITFPETVDAYKRGKITPYEAKPGKAGTIIPYHSKDAEITIYVRTLGDEAKKTSAEFLNDSLAGVKALEAQGHYSNVKFYEFSADKEKPGWKSAAFTSASTNRFIASLIHCKVVPGHLVKIRASTNTSKIDVLQSFTTRFQDIVDNVAKK